MPWYFIVIMTIIGVHMFNMCIAIILSLSKKDTEDTIIILSAFSVIVPLWLLLYPFRIYRSKKNKQPKNLYTLLKGGKV